MSEDLQAKLQEWAGRLGRPVEELKKEFDSLKATFVTSLPGREDAVYTNLARRKLYLKIKGDLLSPAKPYDMIIFGCTGAFDVTAGERAEKIEEWENEETRARAIAEKRVAYEMTDDKGQPIPDGTPLDTRRWIVPPDEETGEKGRKNPRFQKPLEPLLLRSIVAFGRPAKGGVMKLITIAEYGDMTKLIPPLVKAVRTRLNLRDEQEHMYVCNGSRSMQFDPIQMPEYPTVNMVTACKILQSAPAALRPSLAELPAWHEEHKDDTRRLCIIEGDVMFVSREPTQYGSYRITVEDASQENLDDPGTNIWVGEELYPIISTFGRQSKIYAIGRTNTGPGFDRESGQIDNSVERIQMNANAILVDPAFRVPPEEEVVVEKAEEVK